jgi:hypothetical protein
MHPRWQAMEFKRQLEDAQAQSSIVRVYRADLEDGWAHGYVAALGPEFFALELIDKSIRFDGYDCLRYADITECEAPDPHSEFMTAALSARGLTRKPDFPVDMASLPSILLTAQTSFLLVTIHLEDDDDVCFIGKVIEIGDEKLQLLEVTPDAEWEATPTSHDLATITRVSFGGAYEEALHLVAGDPS